VSREVTSNTIPLARQLCTFALACLLAAWGLRWIGLNIRDAGIPVSPPAGMTAARAAPAAADLAHGGHTPGLQFWVAGWRHLNQGQSDARLLALANLGLGVAVAAALFIPLSRALPPRALTLATLLMLLLPLTPGLAALRPAGDPAWPGSFLLLALLHLGLMTRRDARGWTWWLGLGCGALNLLNASAGLASAGALVAWTARSPKSRRTFVANLALLIAGLALVALRSADGAGFAGSWRSTLAWPFQHPAMAAIVWLPVLFSLVAGARDHPIALLVRWAGFQVLALALLGWPGEGSAGFILAVGLIVNFAALLALPAADQRARVVKFAATCVWLILVLDALIHPRMPVRDPEFAPTAEAAPAEPDFSATALPLSPSAATDFRAGAAPDLLGRGGLPIFGTWSRAGGAATGEFVGTPLRTTFSIVQIRVAGTLRPPATTLVLRTESGREISPLDAAFTSNERWKRVNFPAPHEPFRIVARDASATDWIAFSAPVEIGPLTRLAGKIPPLWPWLFAAAFGCAVAAVFFSPHRALPSLTIDPSLGAWQLVPYLALFAYAGFLSHHVDPVAGPNDAGGYLNSAKLLASGHVSAAPRTLFGETEPAALARYAPITFHVRGDGRLVPEYPVGWPLEVAAVAQVLPIDTAIRVLMIAQLVLGAIFTQRLARAAGLNAGLAWMAAAIVALSPVYLFEGLQPVSDVPALVWVTAAIFLAWTSREHPWRAVAAGAATGLAVLIRPSNLLCVVPVLLCLAGRGGWRRFLWLTLAGAPFAAWLLWYQRALYGHALMTGYGDMSSAFAWHFVPLDLGAYVKWLPEFFTPLAVLAVAAPFLRAIEARARLVLAGWFVVFAAFYAFYWCTWDNWYNMRFLLPAAPAAVILALLVLQRLLVRVPEPRRQILTAVLTAGVVAFLLLRDAAREVLYWPGENRKHEVAVAWAREHLPANAVIFGKHATGSLFFYSDFTFVRTDDETAKAPDFLARVERTGRPIYALTYHWETANYHWENGRGNGRPDLPGEWRHITSIWEGELTVWQRVTR
jgi:hypothetical protein